MVKKGKKLASLERIVFLKHMQLLAIEGCYKNIIGGSIVLSDCVIEEGKEQEFENEIREQRAQRMMPQPTLGPTPNNQLFCPLDQSKFSNTQWVSVGKHWHINFYPDGHYSKSKRKNFSSSQWIPISEFQARDNTLGVNYIMSQDGKSMSEKSGDKDYIWFRAN